jgi:hypothetical protein
MANLMMIDATAQAGDRMMDGAACMLAGFHRRPGWSSEAHWAADRAFRSIDAAILAGMLTASPID